MKAFVIKNKEGEYLRGTYGKNGEYCWTKDIIDAMTYGFNEFVPQPIENCMLVPITITEGDLEQENKQLEEQHDLLIDEFQEEREKLSKQIKQESDARKRFVEEVKQLKEQLAEKDNEIEELKTFNARNIYDTICHALNMQEKQIRKQVCDEIQNEVLDVSNGYWQYFKDGTEYMTSCDLENLLKEILDKIKKGA